MRQSARLSDRDAIIALYYAFVRSQLEYNLIIWDPHESENKIWMQRVQWTFTRLLYKPVYGHYPFLYSPLFVSGMVGILDSWLSLTLELRRKCSHTLHYYLLFIDLIWFIVTSADGGLCEPLGFPYSCSLGLVLLLELNHIYGSKFSIFLTVFFTKLYE